MIEVVQTGQAGKTGLLFDMHRLRARVFKETMKWDVKVNADGLEVDQFDLPEAVYLLALNDNRRVVGSWRLLPACGPTMIRDIWPQYLESLPMPPTHDVWEASRFAVDAPETDARKAAKQRELAVNELFCGLIELCVSQGIKEIYSLYGAPVEKVTQRIDCLPYKTSEKITIDGMLNMVGAFRTDNALLEKVRNATGIDHALINPHELPPIFKDGYIKKGAPHA